jgi:hypothetical protein
MARDDLEISNDDDIPPWERGKPAEHEVGTSPLAKQLDEDGTFDRLALRQQVDRRGEEDKAQRDSSKALLGDWQALDDKSVKGTITSTSGLGIPRSRKKGPRRAPDGPFFCDGLAR